MGRNLPMVSHIYFIQYKKGIIPPVQTMGIWSTRVKAFSVGGFEWSPETRAGLHPATTRNDVFVYEREPMRVPPVVPILSEPWRECDARWAISAPKSLTSAMPWLTAETTWVWVVEKTWLRQVIRQTCTFSARQMYFLLDDREYKPFLWGTHQRACVRGTGVLCGYNAAPYQVCGSI